MNAQLDEWKEMQVVKPIAHMDSSWNSPLTVVPKAGGKLRVCIDTRELNGVLSDMPDYPTPSMRDILGKVAKGNFVSHIDLRSAYNQLVLAEEDQHKTAFTAPDGQRYVFTRGMFGLSPMAAYMQQVMDTLFLADGSVFVMRMMPSWYRRPWMSISVM